MDNLVIVINTCENYFKYNQVSLLKQIKESKLSNVIIISGQENIDEIIYLDGIKVIKVKYTGLHHTSAIYVTEHYNEFSKFKYFMFLPDTIHIGKKFKHNLFKYYQKYLQNKNLQILGIVNPVIRPTMDMGIFNIEHIKNISEYFSKIKTYDLSKNNLIKLKKILIFDENTIFGTPICHQGTNYRSIIKAKDKIFLCNDVKDILEKRINKNINVVYFPLLDLSKFQRNFRGPGAKLVLEYNVDPHN
tara:strand:+ start:9533 stop:10270 length:738 start_codon:yes stop_codon:yes gene_type:complete